MDDKKRIERLYLDRARVACSLFPEGEPEPHEPLDFLFGKLGIEITELCEQEQRAEGARLSHVVPKARKMYEAMAGAHPVFVHPGLSPEGETMHVDELVKGLAEFVFNHRDAHENFDWDRCDDMPKGFCVIGVHPPAEYAPDGHWMNSRAINVRPITQEMLATRIAEKNAKLSQYRKAASEVWLLLVNDLFLGPGEVTVRLDRLKQWTFDFDFEKVLFFECQPGGSGTVIELLRADRSVEALHSHA
jgi:hypothetical protein